MNIIKKYLIYLIFFHYIIFSYSKKINVFIQENENQDIINNKNTLNHLIVHVIAHTHDDVGWLKTVDQYYTGQNQSIQFAGVQYILDNVIDALLKNPERKFIYVEIAFFMRWWREQNEYTKEIVKNLVREGRFEFINGGWCMNDEAGTYYSAVIEQMTEGHLFLLKEFGVKPRIGWHIDPFGHAASQASLFAQMGFDAFFFGRIDFNEHQWRNQTKQLEFVWRPSQSLGKETEIWTHVLWSDYCYINGFAWEYGATAINDDPRLFDYNIKERADLYAKRIRERAISYRTNHILAPFGCDFQFQNAHLNFKNMDKLMKYINSHPEYQMTLKYSTPSIYLDEIHKLNYTWPVKTGDFFPYADNNHSYWSGYFTSRPALKGYVRLMNNLLHSVDKLYSSSTLDVNNPEFQRDIETIDVLTQAFSVAQHHDAVAGTEKQHVAYDYAKRLNIGENAAQTVMSKVLKKLLTKNEVFSSNFSFCPYLNVSICPAMEVLKKDEAVVIIIYNPISWIRNEYIRVPVPFSNVEVLDSKGNKIPFEVYPNNDIKHYFNLIFSIQLPAMGFTTIFIKKTLNNNNNHLLLSKKLMEQNDLVLENNLLRITFSSSTGKLSSIFNKKNGLETIIQQDFLWWNASVGNKENSQASGAYIFRPNSTKIFPIKSTGIPTVSIIQGKLIQEINQIWNSWVQQTVRLYSDTDFVEFESTIGPIDISDHFGKEVVTRFTSNLETNHLLYTDSQGQEILERKLNSRDWTTKYPISEPIAMNYYPMNAIGFIKDQSRQFTFISDRSRGCASLENGQFETMLHRRLLVDDRRGVGEPLNESDSIRTTNLIFFDSPNVSVRKFRAQNILYNNRPTLIFTSTSNPNQFINSFHLDFSPMVNPLPPNVHLLNAKTLPTGEVLIRLHHIFAIGEDPTYSSPVTIDLNSLFKNKQIEKITEMNLSANQLKSEMKRLNWKTLSNDDILKESTLVYKLINEPIIQLKPMDIKTFIIRFQNRT
jgi:lysosomal alpha-mannosidase